MAMMRPRLLKNEVDVTIDLSCEDPMGFFDEIEIQQVLVNLNCQRD